MMDRILKNFITYFIRFLFYSYCGTPWRWSQEWPKHVGAENKRHIYIYLNNFICVHFVGLCMSDKFTLTHRTEAINLRHWKMSDAFVTFRNMLLFCVWFLRILYKWAKTVTPSAACVPQFVHPGCYCDSEWWCAVNPTWWVIQVLSRVINPTAAPVVGLLCTYHTLACGN